MQPSFNAYVSGSNIVIVNTYSEPYVLKAVEVEHDISAGSVKPELPYKEESVVSPVRRITERIEVGVDLRPGETYELYFGATERVRKVTAVISVGGKDYRVPLEIRRISGEEE